MRADVARGAGSRDARRGRGLAAPRTLVDRLRAHMHRGDGIDGHGRSVAALVGIVEEVGDDLLALRTRRRAASTCTSRRASRSRYAVTAPAREGGHRGTRRGRRIASAPRCSCASRMRDVTARDCCTIRTGVDGPLSVGADHVGAHDAGSELVGAAGERRLGVPPRPTDASGRDADHRRADVPQARRDRVVVGPSPRAWPAPTWRSTGR